MNMPLPSMLATVIVIVLGCLASRITAQGLYFEPVPVQEMIGSIGKSSSAWSAFVDICSILAPVSTILVNLSHIPTIVQIFRTKTVGSLPLLPYTSMVCCCFIFFVYGVLIDLQSVWIPNIAGVALGLIYVTVFVRTCGPETKNLPGTANQHMFGMSALIGINMCIAAIAASGVGIDNEPLELHSTLLAQSGVAIDIIGKEGVIMCIILFASPLAVIQQVIKTKSAASIPLPFTLASLVSCVAWFVLGWWRANDFNIYFPNVLGFSCSVAQLLLKAMYGNRMVDTATKDLSSTVCSDDRRQNNMISVT